jgi:hypothetical protein
MRTLRFLMAATATLLLSACATGGATATAKSGSSAATASDAAAIANAMDVANSPFVGSRRTKKYYPAACHTVKLIKPTEQVGFGSQKDAEAAGFTKDTFSTDCQY